MPRKDKGSGYRSIPLSINRKMVIASIAVNKRSAIHCVTEIDVSKPRERIREYAENHGTRVSFTAYLVRCLARTLQDHPDMNSFIRRKRIIILDDITVSVLVERELDKEQVPEPVAILAAQNKKLIQIHKEIREAQNQEGNRLGDLTGSTWIRLIPGFLLKTFVRIADRNLTMAKRYGKVAVTAVGMFSKSSTWFIPHGTATVLLTVGAITTKPVWRDDQPEPREILHITASFDHEIVDGAPTARFMKEFCDRVEGAELLAEEELT
jgi:pyruvate/2-oxoglutarate dehydrogenase complex dihydrolipoamide acyltransferase (E2) component